MKKIILSTIVFVAGLVSYAQSPVGKWRMHTMYGISGTGKSMNEFKGIVENDPCLSKIIYHFLADGKINAQGGDCLKDSDENKYVRWKSTGNKTITLIVNGFEDEPDTFELEFAGNKMRWIKRHPDEPGNDADELRVSVMEFVKM